MSIILVLACVAGVLVFAGWLVTRHERKVDQQLVSELAKVRELALVLLPDVPVDDLDEPEQETLHQDIEGKPDKAQLRAITLRAKKLPPN